MVAAVTAAAVVAAAAGTMEEEVTIAVADTVAGEDRPEGTHRAAMLVAQTIIWASLD